MKCNIKSSYMELTVPQFLAMYPHLAKSLAQSKPAIMYDLLNDKDYIVRVAADGRVEFGYKDDDWMIGA